MQLKKSSPLHVEFVGLPGVGKSTLCDRIKQKLQTESIEPSDPIRQIGNLNRAPRIISKSKVILQDFQEPLEYVKQFNFVYSTNQKSLIDFVQVLFNYLYVRNMIKHQDSLVEVLLFDQGIYQAIWSIGLNTPKKFDEILSDVDYNHILNKPDLIIFVETSQNIIENRMCTRSENTTRYQSQHIHYQTINNKYNTFKNVINDVITDVDFMTVTNSHQFQLEKNTELIFNKINKLLIS